MTENQIKIGVIGAGVVGSLTASLVQEALPEAQVTIIADNFFEDTTSHVAAGIFRPSVSFPGPTPDVTFKWLKDSFSFYDAFLKGRDFVSANKAGVIRMRLYLLGTDSPDITQNFFLERIVPDFRSVSGTELESLFGGKFRFGATCTSVLVECRKFLPFLMDKFKSRGGRVVQKKVANFEELRGDFDVVFNCSGLGARELCGDLKVSPIRGQVFKVKAPWVKNALFVDSDTYIIPGTDGLVTLGGTRQFDSTNRRVDKHDADSIWERCSNVLPSLKNAKIEKQSVGLRPYRTEVRVEKEVFTFPDGKSLKVIHNYGHGGYGVLSAPGTSMHAVSLGLQALNEMTKSKL